MGEDIVAHALDVFAEWYEDLPDYSQNNGKAKGTVSGALVLLERLRDDYNLDLAQHVTASGNQIKGQTKPKVHLILGRYGENRKYLSEAGRTNRGLRVAMISLLDVLATLDLHALSSIQRIEVIDALQRFLVNRVVDYHNRQRVDFYYDPNLSGWGLIHNLLKTAAQEKKEGPVAQHLVGAKLQLRFPGSLVSNESFSTADVQTDRAGDFVIADTVFHVTVSPQLSVYEKCQENLRLGLRPYLLVPDRVAVGAKQNADALAEGKITVTSIESFISQNVEELSHFSKGDLVKGFRALLETYNDRVDAVELDKSLLIEIPHNLAS